jgi:type II secretory pathway pseudopilin PulG
LTLLEVLAGLALLATLLAGVLTAYGNHVRQVRRTQLRLKAADAADRMLTDWFQRPGGFPEEGCGTVEMFDGKAKEKNPEVEPILVIDLASSATAKQPRGQGQ